MLVHSSNLKNGAEICMNFELSMGDHKIQRTESYKYLGVLVDDRLNWKPQVSKLCSKLSNVCGILSKVRHYLDRNSLMNIYNSLFDSRLRYGMLAWGTASEQSLSKLRVLQNKAVRFITFSSFRTSMAPLYACLKILPLNEMLFLQKSNFMHSLHYKNLPFALSAYCEQPKHQYLTRYRTSENYVLPMSYTNRSQNSIKYMGPKAWVEVPTNIKEIAFRKPFSKKLKEHILSDIYVEMPPKLARSNSKSEEEDSLKELRVLFESSDKEGDFLGFCINSENESLPHHLNNEEIFFQEAYSNTSNNIDLAQLFLDESANDEFLGF